MQTLKLSANKTILLLTLFFSLVANIGFWRNVFEHAPVSNSANWLLLATMPLFIIAAMNFCLQTLFWPKAHRVLFPLLLVLSAGASYAIMTQGIYFNSDQIQNILQTNPTEAKSWISLKFISWLLLTGILPALFYLFFIRVQPKATWLKGLGWRLASMGASLAVILAVAATSYQNYASFFRNNKGINHQIVPTNFIGASFKTAYNFYDANRPFEQIGLDAKRLTPQGSKKNLLLLVVGETTRAENWGLNSGAPDTTPQLKQMADVINFPQASSCGTSTAISVPCIFSRMSRNEYDGNAAKHQEGLLDMLQRAGLYTSWRENDSGCKGTCDRIKHIDVYKTITDAATRCKGDLCYDTTLLDKLKEEIDSMPTDGMIVLHTNGSHGPAYFERYPPELKIFTPTCDTNQIQDCDLTKLANTYNNTIIAIDDMLAKSIKLLKQESNINTALWYFSDHGESLGEKGIFLHAAPYAIAPSQQTHIPMIFWASPGFYADRKLDEQCLRKAAAEPKSHDNVFHSILGIFDIGTQEYKKELDMFTACRH